MKKIILISVLLLVALGLFAQLPLYTAGGSTTEPTTNGGWNGICSVTAAGGITPYSFKWSNGIEQTNSTGMHKITSLTAGTYFVTITDANGFPKLINYLVIKDPEPASNIWVNIKTSTLYDLSTAGTTVPVKSGDIQPIPADLEKYAKISMNGVLVKKLDMRFTTNPVVKWIKKQMK